jgi:nucleoid-associated protein YgaU
VHVVRQGESLWAIARDLLPAGASDAKVARMVHRLWKLNADRIASGNPDLISVGLRLRLP